MLNVPDNVSARALAVLIHGMEQAEVHGLTAGGTEVKTIKLALIEQSLLDLRAGHNVADAQLILTEFSSDVLRFSISNSLSTESQSFLNALYDVAYPVYVEPTRESYQRLFTSSNVNTYNSNLLMALEPVVLEMQEAAESINLDLLSDLFSDLAVELQLLASGDNISGSDVERYRRLLEQLGRGAQARDANFDNGLGNKPQTFLVPAWRIFWCRLHKYSYLISWPMAS